MINMERNLGVQPIDGVMEALGLSASDVVEASSVQMTHKMVSRARKGRRLTDNAKGKVHRAMCAAAGKEFAISELFNY